MATTKATKVIYNGLEDWQLWLRSFRSHAERANLWVFVNLKSSVPWLIRLTRPLFSSFLEKTFNNIRRYPEKLLKLTAAQAINYKND